MTDASNYNKMIALLKKHEGFSQFIYKCPSGANTIGYGRNLYDVGISEREAEYLLLNDLEAAQIEANKAFPWLKSLSEPRQFVVIMMCFNMGITRLKGFKKMLDALSRLDYKTAANEMINSRWAKQIGHRAIELKNIMDINVI